MNEQNNNFNPNPENPYNYGGAQQQTPPVYDYTQQPFPEQNVRKEPSRGEAIKSMVFGIIAACFACSPFISVLGIIFGAIAKNKGTKIILASPASAATRNFAKAGRITGKIGLIGGIIMTVVWTFYFFIFGIVLSALLG